MSRAIAVVALAATGWFAACAGAPAKRPGDAETPPGYGATTTKFAELPPGVKAGDQLDVYTDLTTFNPFDEVVNSTSTRVVHGALVLGPREGNVLVLALDDAEAASLKSFAKHKLPLVARQADAAEPTELPAEPLPAFPAPASSVVPVPAAVPSQPN